jgi:DNA-binding SARP family transcriptional activator
MEFRILGPLEVAENGAVVDLGAVKQQALLAVLLLHAGEVVSTARLTDELWGNAPPASAPKAVQGYVYGLRKVVGASTIGTRAGGYVAAVDPDRLDVARFERLAEEGRRCLHSDPGRATGYLEQALSLWRGNVLEGLPLTSRGEVDRLTERRLVVQECRIDAELALGRHAEAVPELRELVALEPFRESLRARLMLALYRCGRQAEALEVYRDTRRRLADELGLEPGAQLRRLERQILDQAPELAPPDAIAAPPPRAAPAPAGARRLVTAVRVRLAVDDNDPETQHAVLARCWQAATGVIAGHGGSVDHVADDALVAVFGLTEAHEDDALRAVRAAAALRDATGELRVGVSTGRVYVAGEHATGAPMTEARRLAASAGAGEILLDERTRRLVAGAVTTAGGRLVAVRGEPLPSPAATPLVGRERELREALEWLARSSDESSCRLLTVLGPPGIGKSRLARELFDRARDSATVLVGRCLAYGEGITYRPLAEIVRQIGPERVEALVGADPARRIAGAIGAPDASGSSDETFLAVRHLFEALARERPLLVAIEDVHWAEPTLLDLLDHVAALSTGAPILLVCLARPELLDVRPAWMAPQPNRGVIVLERLSDADSRALLDSLGSGSASRILEVAEGNPLFLEQLAAVEDEETLPDGLHAVLAARIDRLEPAERTVLTHASVEGRSFHAAALAELLGGTEIGRVLVTLVRKGLVRSEAPEFAGQDVFRFAHALIREAAYDGLPKLVRGELHERLGRWLAERGETPDEIVGFHLERAYSYGVELGQTRRTLARDAAQRLAAAARDALARGDLPAGARLLERATALLAADDRTRGALLPALGVALMEAGRLADAEPVLDEAVAAARAQHDRRLEARASVERQYLHFHVSDDVDLAAASAVADRAVRELAAHGDALGQCRAWRLRAWIAWTRSQAAAADAAWARAAEHARAAGEERELFEILGWRASAAAFGATPVPDAIERCRAIREQVAGSPVAVAVTLRPLALLHALAGEFDEARDLLAQGNAVLGELGRMQSIVPFHEAGVELLAGRPEEAERRLRPGYEQLEAMGERALLPTVGAILAQALAEQGADEEAERLCLRAEQDTAAEDLVTRAMCLGVRARVLARRGELREAEALARDAIALAESTDLLIDQGDAQLALADVLANAARAAEANAARAAALQRYERKGAAALIDRITSEGRAGCPSWSSRR